MKYLLSFLYLIPFSAMAGDSSRVVFFRADRMGESGSIYQDDSLIAQSPLHLFYVYNTERPSGNYFWGIKNAVRKTHSDFGTNTSISAGKNSITFVVLKFMVEDGASHNYMSQVSYADFKWYYDQHKVLQKRLHAAGYNSVEDLVKGYTPGK